MTIIALALFGVVAAPKPLSTLSAIVLFFCILYEWAAAGLRER